MVNGINHANMNASRPSDLNNLAGKSLGFAEKVGGGWKETEVRGTDCKAYQRAFLCRQAYGAYRTAKS